MFQGESVREIGETPLTNKTLDKTKKYYIFTYVLQDGDDIFDRKV